MAKSKFAAVFESNLLENSQSPQSPDQDQNSADAAFEPLFAAPQAVPTAPIIQESPAKSTGGKKGNPDFTQVTIYLKRDTHNKARIKLLQTDDRRDFSELAEDLFLKYLAE